MNRRTIADRIIASLSARKDALAAEFRQPDRVHSFVADDLLGPELAGAIARAFPSKEAMSFRKDLREMKYFSAQLDRFEPLMEEVAFAFQDPGVVALVGEITGIDTLVADENLYAAGLSLMDEGCFLNPHLDNSHDKDRRNYRVLNLLYYVTPGWAPENGGHLELWDQGLEGPPREIQSRFDRLAVMATNRRSWHSVNAVKVAGERRCVSNYFFSPVPFEDVDHVHVTSFRGWPEQKLRDVVLQGDNALRNVVGRLMKNGVKTSHVYKK